MLLALKELLWSVCTAETPYHFSMDRGCRLLGQNFVKAPMKIPACGCRQQRDNGKWAALYVPTLVKVSGSNTTVGGAMSLKGQLHQGQADPALNNMRRFG